MTSYLHAESAELVLSGGDYFDRLSTLILSAQKEIHLQTYIIEEDATGLEIRDQLIAAAARGVKVYVLADAFGSAGLSDDFTGSMEKAGIHFRLFSPLFSSEGMYLGRRLHHKILVVDQRIALLGGINLADKYRGNEKEPPWLDLAVLIRGPICQWLHAICEGLHARKPFLEPPSFYDPQLSGIKVRFRRNDWIRRKNEIYISYRDAIRGAQSSITILGSYFMPGQRLRRALSRAARRGVSIRVIVSGKSDVPFYNLAERFLYRKLLAMGAEIYEWPFSVMHGKAMLVDKYWCTIGSYNVNYLSKYRSIELNADFVDQSLAEQLDAFMNEVISDYCQRVDPEGSWRKQNWLFRLRSRLAYYILRWLLQVFIPRRIK